jgi:hypothetical protein
MRPVRGSRHRQRGWAGLLVLLIALLIVGFLAKDALKQYGLMSGLSSSERKSTAPADRLRNPGIGQAAPDMSSAPMAPTTPIEKARGVEDMIKQQAEERAQKMP